MVKLGLFTKAFHLAMTAYSNDGLNTSYQSNKSLTSSFNLSKNDFFWVDC